MGRTSFVSEHRLSTIYDPDKIVFMNHGDEIDSEEHPELLTAGDVYSDRYNSRYLN